jgi:hypothetical protein
MFCFISFIIWLNCLKVYYYYIYIPFREGIDDFIGVKTKTPLQMTPVKMLPDTNYFTCGIFSYVVKPVYTPSNTNKTPDIN